MLDKKILNQLDKDLPISEADYFKVLEEIQNKLHALADKQKELKNDYKKELFEIISFQIATIMDASPKELDSTFEELGKWYKQSSQDWIDFADDLDFYEAIVDPDHVDVFDMVDDILHQLQEI